jgi:GNAT superfamily N-acetyltransferase
MILRPMVEGDAAEVAGLSGQLGYPTDPHEIAGRIGALAGDPDSAILVAESVDHRLLGWVHVIGRRFIESGPSAEVIGLVVDAAVRRGGVGAELLAAAESWASARGYTSMRIRSNTARVEARPFYLKHGYAIVKTQYVFRKDLR